MSAPDVKLRILLCGTGDDYGPTPFEVDPPLGPDEIEIDLREFHPRRLLEIEIEQESMSSLERAAFDDMLRELEARAR